MKKPRSQPLAVALTALMTILACNDPSNAGGGRRNPTSIVLVVVDTLRADHLGIYGYERATSPRIDAWSTGGRVFERAYATSPWTLPSFGSILTGRLPTAHAAGIKADGLAPGVDVATTRSFVTLAEGVPTVAEVLRAAGYATGAFVTNPFLDPGFGLDRGFTDYDYDQARMKDMRRAGPVVDASLAWIDSHAERPFLLLLHMFDPHLEYDAPPPYRGRFADATGFELPVSGVRQIRSRIPDMSGVERAFISDAYDEEVAYVDEQFGNLLDGLERRGRLRDSLLILTADHGEELFEHGGFEHGHSMYDEVLRVPLIISGPGVRVGRETTPVSLIDLATTVLGVAGEAAPAGMSGRSLMVAGDPALRPLIAERALYGPETKTVIVWPYKAIVDVVDGGTRLFDLSADPDEKQDLAAERPDKLRELLGVLSAEMSEARRGDAETRDAELDDDAVERLRALGYLSGGSEEVDAPSDDGAGEGPSGGSR
ncbi:MAG: sulfatase [Acidobacteriota bacterium]|jgi:arylsulfatase A-like enzyme